jgi:transposase InsO family protein
MAALDPEALPTHPPFEQQLLAISARQIDRRLQPKKTQIKKRIYGRTKPGTLLKHRIPIRTDNWDVTTPGFVEIDLVSHSGNSAEGEFIYSLNMTDIHTGWVETWAVLGKGQQRVAAALDEMARALPFPLRGIDSDNGSEFINAHLWTYCQKRGIQFMRGRPYKKDDNAHIEQKNWTHVRKLVGWDRYDSERALQAMNDLYRHQLRLMMNLFQSSVKLVQKVRKGSRLIRKHDAPQTPLDRLAASLPDGAAQVEELKRLRDGLDPFLLAEGIDQKLERIWGLANHRQSPKASAHSRKGKSKPDQCCPEATKPSAGAVDHVRVP